MKYLLGYIMIIRPLNVFLGGLTILISSLIIKYEGPAISVILPVFVVMFSQLEQILSMIILIMK